MSLKCRYNVRISTGLLLHNYHYQFPLPRIYSFNVKDAQFPADSVILTEEIINEKPNFNHKANPS